MTDPLPWRSLDELGGEAGDLLPELARAALIDRRMAMRLMGASLALAAAGCDRAPKPPLRSAPRTSVDPEHLDYATTLDREGHGFGVVVRTIGGRPVKIEGNPLHPLSRGASDVACQAELLSLYDPDRSRTPIHRGRAASWAEARRALFPWITDLRARQGAGLHVVLRPSASPTLERMLAAARAALPGARWYGHRAIEARLDLPPVGEAEVIVSLGDPFLDPGAFQVRLARDWAEARRRALAEGRSPARLVVVESVPTLTGARADERIVMGPDAMLALSRAVAAERAGRASGDPLAARLAAALGPRGLLLAGRDQPTEPRVPAWRGVIRGAMELEPFAAFDGAEAADVLLLGANPAYDAPRPEHVAASLARAGRTVHVGSAQDETARACGWHLPQRHALESWADFRAPDGRIGLAQPVVAPAPGVSITEMLALLAGQRPDGRTLVRTTWSGIADETWLRALEDGVLFDPDATPEPPVAFAPNPPPALGDLVVLFRPAAHLGDGAAANNAWLQELPDPITKLVWGNAATLSPTTARAHGLVNGDIIAITSEGRTIEAPVWMLPGQADDTVALTLGYGRTAAGQVGDGVGYDAYRLRTAAKPWAAPCTIRATGRRERLISTERDHAVPDARAHRRVAPGERAEPPRAAPPTLHPDRKPRGTRAWAMTIDLDACIGCAACTVACQAENNIPAVGADEAARGRTMHWLRVDRAFSGTAEAPAISFQPVPCMHCETAPCEPVCPVEATVHSSEGLNQMVYDRCIGTRSCANNCPYKVRRFNWFDYQAQAPAAPEEAQNPRVRIRERGVIEKCTFCVQRIEASRAPGSPPPATACQQACPTQAIRFGDLNDAVSEVARDRQDPRHYQLLGELNLKPRTTYLARVEPGDG